MTSTSSTDGSLPDIPRSAPIPIPGKKAKPTLSQIARNALETRFPGVTFVGNCAQISINSDVTIAPSVRIVQHGFAAIVITGATSIAEGTLITTQTTKLAERVLLAPSEDFYTSVEKFHTPPETNTQREGIYIDDSSIAKKCIIQGTRIALIATRMQAESAILAEKGSSTSISDSKVQACWTLFSGDELTLKGAVTNRTLQLATLPLQSAGK